MVKRSRQQHQQPLYAEDSSISSKKRSRAPKQHQEEGKIISTRISSQILKEALIQQKEIQDEAEGQNPNSSLFVVTEEPNASAEDGEEENIDAFDGFSKTLRLYDGYANEEEIDEEEEKVLEAFMSKNTGPQQTLADLIIKKIKEKDPKVSSEARPLPKLDQTIIDLYKGVGKLLSRYTTGKVPKAFKYIPSIELWEEVLYLTEPENWSPNALYQATRIFSSNLGAEKARRFYKLVLFPRIREDIRKNKRLHFALFQALKKSLYKPAAFFKGILFPLCESGTCTLREAVIIGSIIQKVSIPREHSSAGLLMLAEMDYCGTTSYFMKLLVEKQHSLPYCVLDAIVAHFMRFLNDTRIMPVIWHQLLLAFVQRYKNGLTKEDKDNLDYLLQHQKHYLVTPEIWRELANSRNHGEKKDVTMSSSSPISVINKPIEEDRFDFPEVPMEED